MLNTIHEYFRNSSLLTGTILNSVPAKFVLFKLLFVNNYLFKGLPLVRDLPPPFRIINSICQYSLRSHRLQNAIYRQIADHVSTGDFSNYTKRNFDMWGNGAVPRSDW